MSGPVNLMDFVSSSASNEWWTPPYLWQGVQAVLGAIDCDPCSNAPPCNVPAALHYYLPTYDGLCLPWMGRVYMNPPYGEALPTWIGKLLGELAIGHTTAAVALVPARTDTVWFQGVWQAAAICFLWRRVRFLGGTDKGGAPFPTVLAYWGAAPDRFAVTFAPLGQIIYPNAPTTPRAVQPALFAGAGAA